MLDKILGSEKEEKIEKLKKELEETKENMENLEEERENERKRAKEAITKKQETDKELKEAKHKIESLEDRIENLKKKGKREKKTKESKSLTRKETLSLLDELENLKSDRSSLVTHYLEEPEKAGDDEALQILRGIDSQTGYIYLKDQFEVLNCILIPPFSIESEFYREKKLKLGKIREILESEPEIYFVSLHAGKSAVGLLKRTEFKDFKLLGGGVKSKHSKGGFSQGRFERRRDEQVQKHLEEVVEHVENSGEEVDYLVLDGNKRLRSELKNRLSISAPLIEKNLNIGKVSGDEKEKYAKEIWSSRLYTL